MASLTEAASAGAAFSAAASLVAAITEAANAGDSVSGGATVYSVSLTELAAAVDVLAASLAGDAGMLDNVRTIRGSARDVIRAAARNIIRGYRPSRTTDLRPPKRGSRSTSTSRTTSRPPSRTCWTPAKPWPACTPSPARPSTASMPAHPAA